MEELQQKIQTIQNQVACLKTQLNQYNDQTVSEWAADALNKAKAKGIIKVIHKVI